jgi:hypothetical protein
MRPNRETRHESQSFPRIARIPDAHSVCNPGTCRHGRAAVPSHRRPGAGESRHSGRRAVGDLSRHSRRSGDVRPHRLSTAWTTLRHHRGGHASPDDHRRFPVRAHHLGTGSRVGRRAGAAWSRAVARARTGRAHVGDRCRKRAQAVSEDRLSHVRGVAALLRHRHGRHDRLPGAARAAPRAHGSCDARRAGSSSGPWRRATS